LSLLTITADKQTEAMDMNRKRMAAMIVFLATVLALDFEIMAEELLDARTSQSSQLKQQ
jgi:hypothetical protein